jgi:hypothetical protein
MVTVETVCLLCCDSLAKCKDGGNGGPRLQCMQCEGLSTLCTIRTNIIIMFVPPIKK